MIRNVQLISDTATPALVDMMLRMSLPELQRRVGPACRLLTETHLAALGPNSRGWPTTRFYEKFARNVRHIPAPSGVVIEILPAQVNGRVVGLKFRYFGGTILPVNVTMLAIPISPVSYGKIPGDFQNLFLLKTSKGAYLVQAGEKINSQGRMSRVPRGTGRNEKRRIRASLNFLFKLMSSVTQEGDPEILPDNEEYTATAREAILR